MEPAMPVLVISSTNTCFGATVVRSLVRYHGAVPGSTAPYHSIPSADALLESVQVPARGAAQLGEQGPAQNPMAWAANWVLPEIIKQGIVVPLWCATMVCNQVSTNYNQPAPTLIMPSCPS